MLLVLLVIVLLICIGVYMIRGTFLSPTLIVGGVGSFCVLIALIGNVLYWGIPYNPMVVLIITVGMISMFCGELLGVSIVSFHLNNNRKTQVIGRIIVPKILNALLFIVGIIVDIYFYRFNKSLGLSALEINQMANSVKVNYPSLLLIAARFVLAVGFVYVYIIANNIVFRIITKERDRDSIRLIPCIISAFICQILFTSRSGILAYLMFFAMSLLVSLYRMNEGAIRLSDFKQIFNKTAKAATVFFVFFLIMGVAMGKFSKGKRLIQLLITYIGGGVLSFSLWYDSFPLRNTSGISETFEGFYSLLSWFGADYDIHGVPNVWLRWMDGSFSTNVIMGFKSYYYDWGLMGVIVVNILVGYIYARLMNKTIDLKTNYPTVLICTYLTSGIIYTFIGRTFSGMFTLAWWSYILLIVLCSIFIFRFCVFSSSITPSKYE